MYPVHDFTVKRVSQKKEDHELKYIELCDVTCATQVVPRKKKIISEIQQQGWNGLSCRENAKTGT